ncbi:nitrilase-related carbon-nitrogen hydrolase [Streptomyces sp. NPDC001851]|uniref:nitrilase-related carbon-nitrogen hydrolase n=1 Tax=Streptomyces sp. NPDC001851 TaxID=3154529 RepID=UPI003324B52E
MTNTAAPAPPRPTDPREEPPPPPTRAHRHAWLLLLLGTGTMLLAVGGRWDIAAAAWIFPVLLLRFTRLSRAWSGALWIWLAHLAAAVFWLQESAIGFSAVVLAGALALSALQTLPFLADRLLADRLRPAPAALVFPAGVAAAEFLITLLSPFGTAYGSLAVTQHADLPLLQVVPVTGPWGVGFLIGWVASTVNRVRDRRDRRDRPAWRGGLVCTAVLLGVLLAGGARLAFFPPQGTTVRIAGVSPSRTVTERLHATLARFADGPGGIAAAPATAVRPAMAAVENDLLDATRREAAAGAKIVVWPEEAVRAQEPDAPAAIDAARAEARRSRVYLEIGVRVYSTTAPAYGRDEALLIDPRGTVLRTYQKAHPIPGSERFTPGDGQVPVVRTPYGRLANVICYDADFPALMRTRADIMLVPAHDWQEYGGAHTGKAALAAVEGGYSLVRQDEEGVTAAYDHEGRVLAATDYFTTERQTTVAYVPVRGVTTVYDRVGDTFAWLCLAALAALTATALVRPRRPAAR